MRTHAAHPIARTAAAEVFAFTSARATAQPFEHRHLKSICAVRRGAAPLRRARCSRPGPAGQFDDRGASMAAWWRAPTARGICTTSAGTFRPPCRGGTRSGLRSAAPVTQRSGRSNAQGSRHEPGRSASLSYPWVPPGEARLDDVVRLEHLLGSGQGRHDACHKVRRVARRDRVDARRPQRARAGATARSRFPALRAKRGGPLQNWFSHRGETSASVTPSPRTAGAGGATTHAPASRCSHRAGTRSRSNTRTSSSTPDGATCSTTATATAGPASGWRCSIRIDCKRYYTRVVAGLDAVLAAPDKDQTWSISASSFRSMDAPTASESFTRG